MHIYRRAAAGQNRGQIDERRPRPPSTAARFLTSSEVIRLQRSAGNQATAQRIARSASVVVQRSPETEYYRANPEPRTTRFADRLLLWNYPVDEAGVAAQHRAQLRDFLMGGGLAWLHAGTTIEVIGWASNSGSAEHNLRLSTERARAAAAVARGVRPGVGLTYRGAGIGSPERASDLMVRMAMNRGVEVSIIVPRPVPVVDRERHWREAKVYLDQRLGGITGGSVDRIWTPTASGVMRLIPRFPLDLVSPDSWGSQVPEGPTTARPASSVMPAPRFETVLTLGVELTDTARRDRLLSTVAVRRTVDRFIAEAATARQRRDERIRQLQIQTSQGGGSAVSDALARYRAFERTAFEGDPTCIWRFVSR